ELEHRGEVAREVPVQRAPLERELVDHGRSERTAATTRSADGMYASSIVQYGYGTSYPVTRSTGPCRSKIAFSAISAASSAPKPTVRGASWTITTRPVFATDARIDASSSGRSERTSTTSQDASPSSASAARSQTG